jgi:hypothetical protein
MNIKIMVALIAQLLLWLVVLVGCFVTAMYIGQFYMLATGSQPGTPISPEDLAPTRENALLGIAYGVVLMVVPFLLRGVIRRWWP